MAAVQVQPANMQELNAAREATRAKLQRATTQREAIANKIAKDLSSYYIARIANVYKSTVMNDVRIPLQHTYIQSVDMKDAYRLANLAYFEASSDELRGGRYKVYITPDVEKELLLLLQEHFPEFTLSKSIYIERRLVNTETTAWIESYYIKVWFYVRQGCICC